MFSLLLFLLFSECIRNHTLKMNVSEGKHGYLSCISFKNPAWTNVHISHPFQERNTFSGSFLFRLTRRVSFNKTNINLVGKKLQSLLRLLVLLLVLLDGRGRWCTSCWSMEENLALVNAGAQSLVRPSNNWLQQRFPF